MVPPKVFWLHRLDKHRRRSQNGELKRQSVVTVEKRGRCRPRSVHRPDLCRFHRIRLIRALPSSDVPSIPRICYARILKSGQRHRSNTRSRKNRCFHLKPSQKKKDVQTVENTSISFRRQKEEFSPVPVQTSQARESKCSRRYSQTHYPRDSDPSIAP